MYILSYNLEFFCASRIKIILNVCGGISVERHKVYSLSYNLAMFCTSGMKIRFDVYCGILAERHKL